jgi:hypothetical protein
LVEKLEGKRIIWKLLKVGGGGDSKMYIRKQVRRPSGTLKSEEFYLPRN